MIGSRRKNARVAVFQSHPPITSPLLLVCVVQVIKSIQHSREVTNEHQWVAMKSQKYPDFNHSRSFRARLLVWVSSLDLEPMQEGFARAWQASDIYLLKPVCSFQMSSLVARKCKRYKWHTKIKTYHIFTQTVHQIQLKPCFILNQEKYLSDIKVHISYPSNWFWLSKIWGEFEYNLRTSGWRLAFCSTQRLQIQLKPCDMKFHVSYPSTRVQFEYNLRTSGWRWPISRRFSPLQVANFKKGSQES